MRRESWQLGRSSTDGGSSLVWRLKRILPEAADLDPFPFAEHRLGHPKQHLLLLLYMGRKEVNAPLLVAAEKRFRTATPVANRVNCFPHEF